MPHAAHTGHSAYSETGNLALRPRDDHPYNGAHAGWIVGALTPFWSFEASCDETVCVLEPLLARLGLRLLRTFDLHGARLALTARGCPHHGTADCDCQMLVVLVYAELGPPVTLVLHGNEGRTRVSLIDRPDQRADSDTMLAIRRLLEQHAVAAT